MIGIRIEALRVLRLRREVAADTCLSAAPQT
jgi:hypothetical protein